MNKTNLDALNELENRYQEESNEREQASNQSNKQVPKQVTFVPNSLDGYIKIDRDDLPQGGVLYPESWSFAYRCPTTVEVANFSTVIDTDQPAIMQVIEDLIRKCVIIFDRETDSTVSNGEICDAHRTFFLLKLREYYLNKTGIPIKTICMTCKETFDANLFANKLTYSYLTDKLLGDFDGRVFNLNLNGVKFRFHVPTLDTSSKVFKYIIKTYRATSNQKEVSAQDNVVHDKQFLLFAPYLFENGRESIRDIIYKYQNIKKNDALFKAYLTVINNIKLENQESFETECPHCGSLEETQISFPGGYRQLFVSKSDTEGYF